MTLDYRLPTRDDVNLALSVLAPPRDIGPASLNRAIARSMLIRWIRLNDPTVCDDLGRDGFGDRLPTDRLVFHARRMLSPTYIPLPETELYR